MYSSNFCLISRWLTPRLGRFTPVKRAGTHCIGDWVGSRASLDGCAKSRPYRDSMPGPSNPQRVAIQTALSRPIDGGMTLKCMLKKQHERTRNESTSLRTGTRDWLF